MKNALQEPQSVLLLGGSSDIGRAIVAELIGPITRRVVLAGRRPDALQPEDFTSRSATDGKAGGELEVTAEAFDADDTASHEAFVQHITATYGDIDVAIVAFGVLGAQEDIADDPTAAAAVAHTNYTGAVSVMVALSAAMKRQGHGKIVVLSSVAGERGRASNYVYGSTKAGLDAFAQGLGDALQGTGVSVLVVRPGFVHSKMTDGLESAPMATTPEKVAELTAKGIRSGAHTVWAPAPIRYVFSGLRHLPRPVFRRLNL